MPAEELPAASFGDLKDGAEFDFVVVGSGFGGSVAALRLAEKGYSVAVLEAGRHFRDREFPRTNWNLRKFLWAPKLLCFGIQRLTLLRDVLVLHGAGVGGGSLVYANVLLEPGGGFFDAPAVRRLAPDLRERLRPHFATARRMLGVTPYPRTEPADAILRRIALETGRGATFRPTDVGVFFGAPGVAVPDPYFGGEGPGRAGCTLCGGCMVGCRHNAKNTLAKNYLWLAARRGARIFSMSTLKRIAEGDGGFLLTVRRTGYGLRRRRVRSRNLVLAAGVLGTLRLLLDRRNRFHRLPPRVGLDVRTNSEMIAGATARRGETNWSEGVAISSGFWPEDETHVEVVRYPAGSDAMSLLGMRLTPPGPIWRRLLSWCAATLRRPLDALRLWWPFGWARRSTILLVMQVREARLRLRSGGVGPWRRLRSEREPGTTPPPVEVPSGLETVRRFAAAVDGIPQATIPSLFNISTTAHILGGAVMGTSPEDGVVDLGGRVFGYDNLWIVDGSVLPANLGVNPSLTIAALAEHAMSRIPGAPPTAARP